MEQEQWEISSKILWAWKRNVLTLNISILPSISKVFNFSLGKESACNVGDLGSIPRLGRSPGAGHGNPLQYPCLENPMNRGVWWVTSVGSQKVGWNWVTKHTHLKNGLNSAAAAAKSLQSCLTLRDPIDGSPPGSAVPGILQARTLEWVATAFSGLYSTSGLFPMAGLRDIQVKQNILTTFRFLETWAW